MEKFLIKFSTVEKAVAIFHCHDTCVCVCVRVFHMKTHHEHSTQSHLVLRLNVVHNDTSLYKFDADFLNGKSRKSNAKLKEVNTLQCI